MTRFFLRVSILGSYSTVEHGYVSTQSYSFEHELNGDNSIIKIEF